MARPIIMPSFGMYTAEGTLLNWLQIAGASVEAGDPVVEIETEKSVHVIEAPVAGILYPVAQPGSILAVEALIGYVLAPGEEAPAVSSESISSDSLRVSTSSRTDSTIGSKQTPAIGESDPSVPELKASPIARRLALEHDLELTTIKGTGPGGRIVESDVLRALDQKKIRAQNATAVARPSILRRVPLTGMRRTIAERLRQTLNTAASLTLTRQVPADMLLRARGILSERLGESISFDALFIKLLAVSLRQNIEMNAAIENGEILVWDEIHIGFAVPVSGGLLVPVVKYADAEPLTKIVAVVRTLRERAGSGQISLDEMSGGTATLTNLGAHGIDAFTPILNPPQAVILGIGRIMEQPVMQEGRVVAGHTCTLNLTFDHRVADGVPAAQLLEGIAQQMISLEYLVSLSSQ